MNKLMMPLGAWILMDKEGGSSSGGQTAGGDNGDPENSAVTEERVNQIVNNAISKNVRAPLKTINEAIEGLTGEESPLMKRLGDLESKVKSNPASNADQDQDAGHKTNKKDNPDQNNPQVGEEMTALHLKIDTLTKRLETSETEKQQLADQQRSKERNASLEKQLDDAGFGKRSPYVLAAHQSGLDWEDDGSDLGRPLIKNAQGESVEYMEFISSDFIKSEAGKDLLPATGRAGSDASGQHTQAAGGGGSSDADYDAMSVDDAGKAFGELLNG